MVWCGVVWCGVVWCGVVWCGVVWCGVETRDGRDSLLQGQLLKNFFSCREISRAGSLCMCCVCVVHYETVLNKFLTTTDFYKT